MKHNSLSLQNLGEIFSQQPESKNKGKTKKGKKKNEKTAINSYFLFCKERRSALHAKNPNLSSREITKMLGEEWQNLSLPEREKYREKCRQQLLFNGEQLVEQNDGKIFLQIQASNGQLLAIPAFPINPK